MELLQTQKQATRSGMSSQAAAPARACTKGQTISPDAFGPSFYPTSLLDATGFLV